MRSRTLRQEDGSESGGRPGRALAAIISMAALAFVGCGIYVPEQYSNSVSWEGGYGRASVGIVPAAGFFGEIEGVGPGVGVSIEMPPFYPVVLVASVAGAVAITAPLWALDVALEADGDLAGDVAGQMIGGAMEGAADAGLLNSGVSNPSRLLLSDFSFDLSFMGTSHADEKYGGRLSYTAGMLGVRVGGNRAIHPRPYLCGGWGLYSFDYDASERSNATVSGPWLGTGAEFFITEGFALALDGRAHFYFGEDNDGKIIDGGLAYGSVDLSWYW